MTRLLQIITALPALLFLIIGLRWLFDPAGVAPEFGLTLDSGLGLSSQIGDMSGYFLTLAACIFTGLISKQKIWFYPAMMLLSATAAGRLLAFFVHDAALASAILVEVVVTSILFAASKKLDANS